MCFCSLFPYICSGCKINSPLFFYGVSTGSWIMLCCHAFKYIQNYINTYTLGTKRIWGALGRAPWLWDKVFLQYLIWILLLLEILHTILAPFLDLLSPIRCPTYATGSVAECCQLFSASSSKLPDWSRPDSAPRRFAYLLQGRCPGVVDLMSLFSTNIGCAAISSDRQE